VKFGSAWPGENRDNEIVSIPGLRGREPKEISLKTCQKFARVVEIVEQVLKPKLWTRRPRKKLIRYCIMVVAVETHQAVRIHYGYGYKNRISKRAFSRRF
jgi:hypothetical protein